MNLSILSYSSFDKKSVAAFKGCTETTTLKTAGQNKDTMCIHETYFFRNLETLNFAADYIKKHFKSGTNIAEFASSTGEEAYSLAMILSPHNKDKKYKIHGYDITPRIIERMDDRLYEITTNDIENFLDNNYYLQTQEQQKLKGLFLQHFEKMPVEWQYYNYSIKNLQKLNKKLAEGKSEEDSRNIKYMISYSKIPIQDKWGSFFIPKKDAFKDIVSFEVKDISELGEKYKLKKNTGVVFFKNAFYHLTGFNSFKNPNPVDLSVAKRVTQEVNKSLEKDGIFVIGALSRDHLYNNQETRVIFQDGKKINVCDDTQFHHMLRECGFEPVFYEKAPDVRINNTDDKLYLASVWKKVKEV